MSEADKFEIDEEHEVLEDFHEEFSNKHESIEAVLAHLDNVSYDPELLKKFYLEISSLKSNAGICNLAPIVEPLHSLESFVERIITRKIKVSSGFVEAMLIFMDKILALSKEAAQTKKITFSAFNQVQSALHPISICADDEVDLAIQKSMQALLGDFMLEETSDGVELFEEDEAGGISDGIDLFGDDESGEQAIAFPENNVIEPVAEEGSDFFMEDRDMAIFRIIADTIDFRHPVWRERDNCVMSIALGMNGIARNPVPFEQLEAAVYMRDFGMLRLPDELFFKTENLSEQEEKLLQSHPVIGYEVLSRMGGWDQAAEIVFQHLEREDGNGYPEGATGDKICDGAKILAVCDTFYQLINNYADQEPKRAAIRAVAEINSLKGTKLDAKWVDIFNKVIRIQNRVKAI